MSEVEHGGGRARQQRSTRERSTRRDVLAALSAVGAAGVLPSAATRPAAAEPDSERPKAGDLFVAQAGEGSESVLPLKIVDGKLAVAKPFIGRVGIVPT